MKYILIIFMVLLAISGCGKQDPDNTTVIVEKGDCKDKNCKPKNINIRAPGVNINIEK